MSTALIIAPKKYASAFETNVQGVPLAFSVRWMEGGTTALAADLDMTHPAAPAAVQSLNALGFTVLLPGGMVSSEAEGADERSWEGVPVAPATFSPDRRLTLTAIQAGWDVEDLIGTSRGGHADAKGGRSILAGLTLVELALSAPPREWPTKRATLYPWQVSGWSPPTPSWKPQKLPQKPEGGVRYVAHAYVPSAKPAEVPAPAPAPVAPAPVAPAPVAPVEATPVAAPAPEAEVSMVAPATGPSDLMKDLLDAQTAGGERGQAASALLLANHPRMGEAIQVARELMAARPDAPAEQFKSAMTRQLGRGVFPPELVAPLVTFLRG